MIRKKSRMLRVVSRQDLAEVKKFYDDKRLTTANIAMRILKIMEKHIGTDNEISRRNLFKQIFKREERMSVVDELAWDFVKKAMHLCRQKSKCFIGSRYFRGVWRYFVLETMNDASYYVNTLNNSIKRMNGMKKKAIMSVNKGWSKSDWLQEVKEKKQIGYTEKLKV